MNCKEKVWHDSDLFRVEIDQRLARQPRYGTLAKLPADERI